jgi:hypothetical protein
MQDNTIKDTEGDPVEAEDFFKYVIQHRKSNKGDPKEILNTFIQKWQVSERSLTVNNIGKFLHKQGVSNDEINKAFDEILGKEDDSPATTKITPAVQNLANLIKKEGMADSIIKYMQDTFKYTNAASADKTITTENVKAIFTYISSRAVLTEEEISRLDEYKSLGRHKKEQLNEVTLGQMLKLDQYVTLLNSLKTKIPGDINIIRIKNQVLQSWKRGMKSRKHYDDLLGKINLKIGDLIDK